MTKEVFTTKLRTALNKMLEQDHNKQSPFPGNQALLASDNKTVARRLGESIQTTIEQKNEKIDQTRLLASPTQNRTLADSIKVKINQWFKPTGLIRTWNKDLKEKHNSRLKGEYRLGLSRVIRGPIGRKIARTKDNLTGGSSGMHVSCDPNFDSLIQVTSGKNEGRYFPANRVKGAELDDGAKRRGMILSSAPVMHAGIEEYVRLLAQESQGKPEIFHLSMVYSEFNTFFRQFHPTRATNGSYAYRTPTIQMGNTFFYIEEVKEANDKSINVSTPKIIEGRESLTSLASTTHTKVAKTFTPDYDSTPTTQAELNKRNYMESVHVKEYKLVEVDAKGNILASKPLHYGFYPNYHDNLAYAYDAKKMEPLTKFYTWIQEKEAQLEPDAERSLLFFNCKCGANRSQAVLAGQIIHETMSNTLKTSLEGLSEGKAKQELRQFQQEMHDHAREIALTTMLHVGMSAQAPQFSQIENVTTMVKAIATSLTKEACRTRNLPVPPLLPPKLSREQSKKLLSHQDRTGHRQSTNQRLH